MPLREELVANAVRFLHNDTVQGKPEEEKRVFLTQKGLTEAEIAEALHRAAGGSASSSTPPAPVPTHPPSYDMYPPQYPPQQYVPPPIYYAPPSSNETPWWKVVLSLAGALGLGFAASTYYSQEKSRLEERRHGSPTGQFQLSEYASPQRAVDMASPEPVRETSLAEPSVHLSELEELLKQQAKDHKEMMQRLLESNRQHTQSLQQLTQKVAQLTLNQTIKPQADLSDASLHVLQEALLDALQKKEDNVSVQTATLDDSLVEKISACLKVISEESDTKEEAKKSLSMLNTILENLRRHPENEKYRKVNTTSNRFKDRFSLKQRADEFFTALGFEESGPNFVFPAGPISPTVHKAMTLISDMLKNLDHQWTSAVETTVGSFSTEAMPWASSVSQDRSKVTSFSMADDVRIEEQSA